MTGSRPRTRFVPTLTEVVRVPGDATPTPEPAAMAAAELVGANPSRSMLEAAVDDLMPRARERLRESLHTAAYALAEEQLRSMEDELRQRLRAAVREASGMGRSASPVTKD
ncbi:hypothetical protein RQP54_10835 [Curvibacter sp. APW13]|uniref:hypothetical protein n=1 Tax=Curvibacter sp. APW13 TaxID=3077236 RepID=UPI0028DF2161|nr:hypothetical protein [Curvibacter sp. APW13]MDT8991356.1 hypothetical protein [Curvibacter sp. APW13]